MYGGKFCPCCSWTPQRSLIKSAECSRASPQIIKAIYSLRTDFLFLSQYSIRAKLICLLPWVTWLNRRIRMQWIADKPTSSSACVRYSARVRVVMFVRSLFTLVCIYFITHLDFPWFSPFHPICNTSRAVYTARVRRIHAHLHTLPSSQVKRSV